VARQVVERGLSALEGSLRLAGQRERKGSFDVFLAEKDLDIETKSYKDIFPMSTGPEAGETTSRFLYAVVEILIDFINQTNDRDAKLLDFHHPSQITKAMDFTISDQGHDLEQLVVDCRAALRFLTDLQLYTCLQVSGQDRPSPFLQPAVAGARYCLYGRGMARCHG
jgi:hypothetical protein